MRNKFTKIIPSGLLMLGLVFALNSCSKDVVQPVALDQPKMDKIEQFISIMWEVPKEKVSNNQKNNEYSFGQFKLSKEVVENLYDNSNEYKAKYEK